MRYQLFAIPHDKNLEQFAEYIDDMAARMAEQYSRMPEMFDYVAPVSSEPDNMLQTTPNNSVQPRIMMVEKTYTEYQNYAVWFAMAVNLVVTWNLDYPSYKWIKDVPLITGYCSYAGTLAGYTFHQDVVNTRWSKNDNGTVHCYIPGSFTVTYKGIVEQMGGQVIEGDFGSNKI